MANLESLSNGLKTFVFEMLPTTNLYHLAAVFRTLNAAVTPALYRAINISCSDKIPNHVHDSI